MRAGVASAEVQRLHGALHWGCWGCCASWLSVDGWPTLPSSCVCSLAVRIVLKALLAVAAFAVAIISVCLCWFYFYSGDLPYFSELANLAPDSAATVSDQCSATSIWFFHPLRSARTCVMRSAPRKVRTMRFWLSKSHASCSAIRE